jgi:hypothetical protein
MRKVINWLSGFFNSEKGTSSKRLVGIIGSLTLFASLYQNPTSDALVWGTVSISSIALGLKTIESVSTIIKQVKGNE